MISRIEIENFQSIRDRQVLDLVVPGNAPKSSTRLAKCWPNSDDYAPKVVAVFGANGAGKSNVLRALSFAIWFIGDSFSLKPEHIIPFGPFNDMKSKNEPTRIKIWTFGPEGSVDYGSSGTKYCKHCYELTISNGAQRIVTNESIYYWPSSNGRRTRLIERFEDGTVKTAKFLKIPNAQKTVLETILRPNASVISTLAQLNHPFALLVVEAMNRVRSNIFIVKNEPNDDQALRNYIDRPDLLESFNNEIGRIDTGVRSLDIERTAEGPTINFTHHGLNAPMPFFLESHGTQQFIKMFPYLFDVLQSGGIAIIDELDSAIHPMILPELLRWFYDPIRNPYNAQLWMSCHNTALLEDLSKDEVVFCEKSLQGSTEIYTLNDIKATRRDDNYYKKYMGGTYGAVPKVG